MMKVLEARTGNAAKKVSAKLSPMERIAWLSEHSLPIMRKGMDAKFADPKFETDLLSTGNDVLIDASPYEKLAFYFEEC